ncbi:ABC transporter substrate-binding protein [Rummeliibacillus stabekisii]|uniref:ABC transporter substrate-binding protein n=1 Tax=Rummeliibacillus stabekisii TaxID=241244 RepID=UPI00116800C8|nr:ABC transporter substrate-binding protein [Rummeliibacillus stabekisii]MBB5171237.1 branched-chain amino acid transport system substrate-binding protein [Rummeliibacillus stabekisii]GEL06060.1 ethanolamine utilization protein EutJ [Rummeliibacillus stabekisii]
MVANSKLKKYASVFLASSLVVGLLAGCGSKDQSTTSGSKGNSSKEVKIGLNLELSGNVASYGSGIAKGARLAIKEINDNGGIDGKKIVPVEIDNKSDAAEATAAAIKLATQEKVVAQIGSATSGNTVAAVQIANKNKMPVIGPSATSPTVTVNSDNSVNEYAFRTCFIDPFQGRIAANFALNTLKAKNVAIFSDSASDYAKGLAKSFKETIEENGGKVVAEESYVAKDTDFKSTLTRLKSKKPDFIYIPGYYEEVGLIVKQAREAGITVPLMGGDGWDSPKMVELAGGDSLNNTFFTNHYSSEDPDEKIQKFVEAFKGANKDQAPDAFNALGYDTVYWLKDAIERAGSTDGEKVKDALAETKDLSLVTGTFSVDENHHPVKSATVLEFKDGKQVFNSKVNP